MDWIDVQIFNKGDPQILHGNTLMPSQAESESNTFYR